MNFASQLSRMAASREHASQTSVSGLGFAVNAGKSGRPSAPRSLRPWTSDQLLNRVAIASLQPRSFCSSKER